jgi:hypothetical protein
MNFQELDSSTVTKNTIRSNMALSGKGGGIRCKSFSSPTIDSCTISYNSGHEVFCGSGANPQIHLNDIIDSTDFGVYNADSLLYTINAEYNWWGEASGPYHPISNPSGSGSAVSGGVDYDLWLNNTVVKIVKSASEISPNNFNLSQNFPNPFNPNTKIEFELPRAHKISLKIFNILGEEVETLLSGFLPSGSYQVEWSPPNSMASGMYLYRLQAGSFNETRKMLLVR